MKLFIKKIPKKHCALICSHTNTESYDREVLIALDSMKIIPFFQPSICIKTHNILGFEVLARWLHPIHGMVSPLLFLDRISKLGLNSKLLTCVLKQGLECHKQMHDGGKFFVFSYNVEASQLAENGFAARLIRQVETAGVPLNQIILELTEKETLDIGVNVLENVRLLKKRGIRLSLDDFGTGYSSLTRLAEISFSQIKLDAGFIARINEEKYNKIIKCVVSLSQALSLELVAEGVETEEQYAHVYRLGVDSAQGYLFYKPMNRAAVLKLIFG